MPDLITAGDIQWDVDSPCGDTGPDGLNSPEKWARAQALAVQWVWALSGRRFGLADVVFRPEWTDPIARRHCWPGVIAGDLAYLGQLPWMATKPVKSAPLPGPVQSVTGVLVNGSAVSSGGYMAVRNQLIRTDGGTWPAYQDITHPVSADGTWQITYVRGLNVPAGGAYAAGVLACELAKGMCGDKTCRLPANAQSVARNGVSISLDASQLQKGYTTIREVDQWCRQVNPNGRPEQPTVWSPDLDPNLLPPIPATA